jgi:hypothetical protein
MERAMKTSGDRASWLNAVANNIMDGETNPPSMEQLYLVIPDRIVTGINDGHVSAAIAFGENQRDDYRAGQRFIIQEMVEVLHQQGFINGDEKALRWLKPLDGIWQVKVGDRNFTLRGQRERRWSSERHLLGQRDEVDGSLVGPPGLLSIGKSRPFEVEVIGPRGGSTIRRFQVHPLALTIPPMTEAERETLRASILNDGVKVPLTIFQDKVLDGRNRLYFASVLKKPVEIEEFTGTEDEARRHVAILNLHRRHLNAAQRIVSAVALLGEQARKEMSEVMKKAASEGNKSRSPPKTNPSLAGTENRGPKWEQIVAREANKIGLNVTPSGIRAMKEVMDAPETRAKIERGEIRKVAAAHAAALAEKGKPLTTDIHAVQVQSINNRLGKCVEHLNAILADRNMPAGGKTPDMVSARLEQIETLVIEVRQALRDRLFSASVPRRMEPSLSN